MRLPAENHLCGVIFDLDGVVLDSMPSHVASWGEAFAEFGLPLEPRFFYLNEGAFDLERLCQVVDPEGKVVTPENFHLVWTRQRALFMERYADKVRVFPAAAELLDRLKGGPFKLALVTSSRRDVLAPEILSWLEARFPVLITGEAVANRKPHPEPYLKALSEMQLRPDQAVVVENAPAGIRSAHQAGICCLALPTTLSAPELAEADLVLTDHQALAGWLDERYSACLSDRAEEGN